MGAAQSVAQVPIPRSHALDGHGMKGFSLPGGRGTAQITSADSADSIYQTSPTPRSTEVTVNCTEKSGFGGTQPLSNCTFPSTSI